MRGFPLRFRMAWALLVAASISSGCGVYQAGVRTGPSPTESLPPIDPSRVEVFGGELPSEGGQEVGFVVGVSDLDEEWLAMQRLRAAAAKLGADTIVDLRFDVLQSSQIVARGRAVRRSAVTPMPEPTPPPTPPTEPQPVPEPEPTTAQAGGQP